MTNIVISKEKVLELIKKDTCTFYDYINFQTLEINVVEMFNYDTYTFTTTKAPTSVQSNFQESFTGNQSSSSVSVGGLNFSVSDPLQGSNTANNTAIGTYSVISDPTYSFVVNEVMSNNSYFIDILSSGIAQNTETCYAGSSQTQITNLAIGNYILKQEHTDRIEYTIMPTSLVTHKLVMMDGTLTFVADDQVNLTKYTSGMFGTSVGSKYEDLFNNYTSNIIANPGAAVIAVNSTIADTFVECTDNYLLLGLDGASYIEFGLYNAIGNTLPGFRMNGLTNYADLTAATTDGLLSGDMFRIGHLICVVP
jgi:hypothetical protein